MGLSVGIGGSAMNAMSLIDDKLRSFAVFYITGAPDPVTGVGEYTYRQYNDDTDLAWQSSVNSRTSVSTSRLSLRTTGLSATTRSTPC